MGASKTSIFLLLTLVSLQRFNLSNSCLSPLNMDQTPALHSIAEPSKSWGWQGPLEIAQSNLLLKAGPLIELCRFLSNLVISSKGNGTTYSNVYFFSCCTILPYHMAFLSKLFASITCICPYASLWKEFLIFLCKLHFRYWKNVVRFSQDFSRLNIPCSFNFMSSVKPYYPLIILEALPSPSF